MCTIHAAQAQLHIPGSQDRRVTDIVRRLSFFAKKEIRFLIRLALRVLQVYCSQTH